MVKDPQIIGIVGGTGKEGKGLAFRWVKAGHQVIIGSRMIEKAQAAVQSLLEMGLDPQKIRPAINQDAIHNSTIVVLTVPFSAHVDMLNSIKPFLGERILIDVTVPLVLPKVTKVQLPPAGSAGLEARTILGDSIKLCTAFQNISYENLLTDKHMECDVLVCGTDKESREYVLQLVNDAGLTGWDAGPLENSVVAEGMTSILIGLNKKYGVENAGIKITGIPRDPQ